MSGKAPFFLTKSGLFAVLFFLTGSVFAGPPVTKEQIFQFGTLAARDEQYEQAIELFKKVIDMDPKFAPAYNSIGLVYQAMEGGEMNAEALRYFKMAVDIEPGYVECWNNLGRACYSQGAFVQAEKALLKSLELKPAQPDVLLVLGWVYLIGESRAEKAISFFEQGLASRDDDMAHYGLGLAYVLLGNKFKVLDQITELRHRHKEEKALSLEAMIRGDIKLTSKTGSPLITGKDTGPSIFDQQLDALSGHKIDANDKKEGIQVRLKGPLAY